MSYQIKIKTRHMASVHCRMMPTTDGIAFMATKNALSAAAEAAGAAHGVDVELGRGESGCMVTFSKDNELEPVRAAAAVKAERYVGRINTDILCGWETGLKGQERINGKLYPRQPPEHLSGARLSDWYLGFDSASRLLSTRQTIFTGRTKDGPVKIKRQGWVARRSVISRMEKMGVGNSVDVFYLEAGEIVRTQNCGI
jgi:hypothetical protein